MNGKNEVFKMLLPIEKLFALYQALAETIITKIDLKNLKCDPISIKNSVELLCDVGFIQYDEEKDVFRKSADKKGELSDFAERLYQKLRLTYPNAFLFLCQVDLKYDEAEAKLYIKRNSVNLNLSGLIMLLDGLGRICVRQNTIFILDKSLLDCRKNRNYHSSRQITVTELKNQIEVNEEYGVEAELAAMEYEAETLKNAGINRSPERISEYHTNAGYDIISYMHVDSATPDKFIEVKSCSDDRWTFFISRNELDVAKNKQDNYFLYLYNRKSQHFRVIQNPYPYFMERERMGLWSMDPQVYRIRSLESLSLLPGENPTG